VPYSFGSGISRSKELQPKYHEMIRKSLVALLPVLADAEITHRWGGVLAVPRNWTPSVRFDRSTGLAVAGGYVGEGVAAANLAGRTLADLITGTESERVDLPWVGAPWPKWEPEPFRFAGVRGGRALLGLADALENRRQTEARFATTLAHLIRG
jgi:glycine/D-amino acid oxidase-like deaminating enzyme